MTSRTEHQDKLNDFAAMVCPGLPGTWVIERPADDEHPSGVIITDETGRAIHFGCWANTAPKVTVGGIYPDEFDRVSVGDRPAIGVSMTRSPQAVARDIERRFLPDYDRVRQLVIEAIERRDGWKSAQRHSLIEIARALHRPDPDPGAEIVYSSVSDDGYGDFRPNHNGSSYTIDLKSVTRAKAVEIAKIIGRQ